MLVKDMLIVESGAARQARLFSDFAQHSGLENPLACVRGVEVGLLLCSPLWHNQLQRHELVSLEPYSHVYIRSCHSYKERTGVQAWAARRRCVVMSEPF